jgi:DNA polymerase IIIc chi subunit
MLDPKLEDAISAFIKRLDERAEATRKSDWSAADDKLLKQLWRKRTTYYVAHRLNRDRRSVKNRAVALNLEKGTRNAA